MRKEVKKFNKNPLKENLKNSKMLHARPIIIRMNK
jgi:hypothetical protein